MTDNETVIRNFVDAWARLDVDEIVSYFAEDGIYHNIPASPVQGHENLKTFISGFIQPWTATDWEITNLICADDTVIAERVDRTKMGDKGADLPCCGVFEMGNGKIKVWRDYFDLGTYMKAFE